MRLLRLVAPRFAGVAANDVATQARDPRIVRALDAIARPTTPHCLAA